MKKTFQKIPLMTSALIFIFCSVAVFFIYAQINKNNQKAQEGRAAWQAEQSRRQEIKTLDQTLLRIADKRAQLDTHFAQSSNVVPFLDTMENLGTTAGAEAHVTSVDTPANTPGLVVGMKASGSFESIYRFLTLLENSPYELEIVSFNVHRSDALLAGAGWDAILKLRLLSYIP